MTTNSVYVKDITNLAYLLKQTAPSRGLSVDSGGYVSVDEILTLPEFNHLNSSIITSYVVYNPYQDFLIKINKNKYYIGANDGHLFPVLPSSLYQQVTPKISTTIPYMIYGCNRENLDNILRNGITPIENTSFIYFSTSLISPLDEKTGITENTDTYIFINFNYALMDGISFFLTNRTTIVTHGDKSGVIPSKYICNIVDNNMNHIQI